ncbi:GNAT family N-acetyltransferase [Phenylobacterium sp. J367]|uniref:GNAT family N-acetyltransferase n=1 Tax=Phenylobacterium sp. J367 TaxID=2898435 RepID=UPI0021512D6F|nr:GNAT family N-acetyltransferase [Phenylobacterium sp. J367]MCR5877765.1 GNAT family N-acetyltransferase [Phenylobacterium sp. J367]
MIETGRLILRPWRDADRDAFAEVNAHPDVGRWLAGVLDRAQSDAMVDRLQRHQAEHGFCFFAAERKADGRLIGAIGAQRFADDLPEPGEIELGWRLHPEVQGQGLATEGAQAVRDWVFATQDAGQVLAITAETNLTSQAVMRKIGMVRDPDADFDHPRLAADHPLRRHVLFRIRRWGSSRRRAPRRSPCGPWPCRR